MIRIKRAHDYSPIYTILAELNKLPLAWVAQLQQYQFIVYPDDLSPVWTGLVFKDTFTHDGERLYSTVGGWCAGEEHGWFCADTPHIFLRHSSVYSTIHEAAHALVNLWHTPIDTFFNPSLAFYSYMASNPAEYFACAMEAYFTPEQETTKWNKHDLAKRDHELYRWIDNKANERI